MRLEQIKAHLVRVLENHYAFEQYEFDDMTRGKVVKELDIDSIALLELFLVIEDAFELNVRLSARLDMKSLMDSPVEKLFDVISLEILKVYKEATE